MSSEQVVERTGASLSLVEPSDEYRDPEQQTSHGGKSVVLDSGASRKNTAVNCYIIIIVGYFRKFGGVEGAAPPSVNRTPFDMLYSSILAFIGLFLLSLVDYFYLQEKLLGNMDYDNFPAVVIVSGAFAASSVLFYECYTSPLSQPIVFGSYAISSFSGVSIRIVGDFLHVSHVITAPLAVAVALLLMNLTKTVHPPAGAVSLGAMIGGRTVEHIGFIYCLTSVGAGFLLIAWAVIGNNLSPSRRYPQYWR
jgi:CBS domain-containing membrane protein